MPHINDAKAVDLLENLLNIYSPSKREHTCAKFVAETLRDVGFDSSIDKYGNAVGVKGTGPEVLLFSHLDTVSGNLPVKNHDGFLHGRGACDAKSALAAMVVAAANSRAPLKLMVAGVVEEENESSKGAQGLLQYATPSFCILGEPSNADGVVIGYKGRLLLDCRVVSEKSHSSGGSNAIEQGLSFYNQMQTLFDCGEGFDKTTFRMTYARAGSRQALNVNPAEFRFVVDVRLPPGVPAEQAAKRIESIRPATVKLYFMNLVDAVQTDPNHVTARSLVHAIRKNGLTPRYVKKMGTSDMNLFDTRTGIVAFGPGEPKLSHTDVERVTIKDYLTSIRILESALERLASAPVPLARD